jgi:hypothetical protein
MDERSIVHFSTVALYALFGVIGWFVRILWEADKELRHDLAKLREELPGTYVRRDHLAELKDTVIRTHERLERTLERIEVKLDSKVDKS